MTSDPRTAAADELLQALTVGELTPEDPLVAARLAQDPALRARWRALAATLASLRELDAGMRGDSAIDVTQVDTTGTVRAFRGRTISRTWLGVGALAAAILLVVWLLQPGPQQPPDPRLGGGAPIVGLAPNGARWDDGAPLSWQPVPRAAGYRLHVEALREVRTIVIPDGERGGLLVTTSWLPSPTERADLPAEFRWRVLAFDASDNPIANSEWATTRQ